MRMILILLCAASLALAEGGKLRDIPSGGNFDPRTLFLMNFANGSVVKDWTGRNTPSVVKAPTLFQYTGGNYVHFDGATTVTNINSGFTPVAVGITNITCFFWFRFTNDTTAVKDALGSEDAGTASSFVFVFNPAATAGRYGGFMRGDGVNALQAICTNLANYTDGNWHCWATVISNYNSLYQYMDGAVQINISSFSNNVPSAFSLNQPVFIGARNSAGTFSRPFNGDLSDIRVIGAAYGQPEIQKLMQETYRR